MEQPLDDNLKDEIDNLDNLSEEQLLNLERQLDGESSDKSSEVVKNLMLLMI